MPTRALARTDVSVALRIAAQIVPVQLDQVEGVQEHAVVVPAISDQIKRRVLVVVTRHRLAVTMQDRDRNPAKASTISEKRSVRSLPGRL